MFGPFERVDLLRSHVLCVMLRTRTLESPTHCKADAPKPWRRILTGIKASMCCRMLLPQFYFFSFCVLVRGAKLKNTKWISQPISCPSPRVRPSLTIFPANENTQTAERDRSYQPRAIVNIILTNLEKYAVCLLFRPITMVSQNARPDCLCRGTPPSWCLHPPTELTGLPAVTMVLPSSCCCGDCGSISAYEPPRRCPWPPPLN